jgi:hypothetical protein
MTRDVADSNRQRYQLITVVQNMRYDTKKLAGGLAM